MTPAAPPWQTDGPPPAPPDKRPWHQPVLERLGPWRALTLQQSIPIGPGTGFLLPQSFKDGERLA